MCWIYATLANLEVKNRQYQLAAGFFEKLLDIKEQTEPKNRTIIADIYIDLGKMHQEMRNIDKARRYFEKALDTYETIEPPGSIKQMVIEDYLVECYEAMKS